MVATFFFAGIFLYTSSTNSLIIHEFYAFGPHALWVWANSLHKLAFPWLYLLLVVVLWRIGWRPLLKVRAGVGWILVALLPYIFLTYQAQVPSRNMYLASMGLVSVLAVMLREIDSARIRKIFVAAFVAINIGYIWFVKDAQFEERAASTTQLVEQWLGPSPAPLLIVNFPQTPGIAKYSTRVVPGWEPEMVLVNQPVESCLSCLRLRWNPQSQNYIPF